MGTCMAKAFRVHGFLLMSTRVKRVLNTIRIKFRDSLSKAKSNFFELLETNVAPMESWPWGWVYFCSPNPMAVAGYP